MKLITDGISKALYKKFGLEVITEKMKQGFNEPCFFIKRLKSKNKRLQKRRKEITNNYVIRYFSESNDECEAVGLKLMETLEFLTLESENDTLRGYKMYYEIIDSVLHFFITYKTYLVEEETGEMMESLVTSINIEN